MEGDVTGEFNVKSITYRAKNKTVCPVCHCNFKREELHSGGGRMNAGELTDELHRIYLPTEKYGKIYPLLYPVTVCPQCWYAAYPRHFTEANANLVAVLKEGVGERKNAIKHIFPNLDFFKDRKLREGVASYFLAAACYDHRGAAFAPSFMRALSFLRAAWLSMDLHASSKDENYDYLAGIFYRKATFFYTEAIEADQRGLETLDILPHHGPDIDNNYGIDGIYFLTAVLLLKYGPRGDVPARIASLKTARSAVSRIVGMGKSSKAKPSALLDLGRGLHKTIKQELESIDDSA